MCGITKLMTFLKQLKKRDKLLVVLIVMQLICLSVTVASIVVHFNGKKVACESGWVWFNGSCYNYQLYPKKTWNEAKKDCQMKGGFLVKIEDAVENEFLLKNFLNGTNVWIGAYDLMRESHFIWVSDNSTVTFNDWESSQPDNWKNGEDCVQFHSTTKKWNDALCSQKNRFICEKH